jgi:hypothetical protein
VASKDSVTGEYPKECGKNLKVKNVCKIQNIALICYFLPKREIFISEILCDHRTTLSKNNS